MKFADILKGAEARFQVPVGEFKAFCALAYCNIHGLWQNCVEIE
jgi:superoxide reductase